MIAGGNLRVTSYGVLPVYLVLKAQLPPGPLGRSRAGLMNPLTDPLWAVGAALWRSHRHLLLPF